MEIPPPASLMEQIDQLPAGPLLLERLGGRADVYLVGGAVRDLLLGGRPLDLDLVVEGDVGEVAEALGGARVLHDRFGTSTVIVGGHTYDLAQARRERYPRPGALPEVEPAPLEEDLTRRDFTVNAMAIGLGGERRGELLPAALALEDLAGRRLRVMHRASFLDDPTRLLRLVRYGSRLGFATEPQTRELALDALGKGALNTVTSTRLGNELRLVAAEPDPVAGLGGLHELGLDEALHPRFGFTDDQVARRALALLPPDGRPDRLVLAAASRRLKDAELASWLDAMGFPSGDREVILVTATRAGEVAQALETASVPSEISRAARAGPVELVALAGALGPQEAARDWLERLRGVRLEIDGRDLLAAGAREGPEIGRALRATLEAKLDGRVSGRRDELALALSLTGGAG